MRSKGLVMDSSKLREVRKYYGITQSAWADFLGITRRTYAAYERGEINPPNSLFISLYRDHHVNLNWLIADADNMFNLAECELYRFTELTKGEKSMSEKIGKESACFRLPVPLMNWIKRKAYTRSLDQLKNVTCTDIVTEILQQAKEREENEQNI